MIIRSAKLTNNLELTECSDGFWLYDKTRGMNLSMRAVSEQAAFVDGITYYQKRLATVEQKYKELNRKVVAFVEQCEEEDV